MLVGCRSLGNQSMSIAQTKRTMGDSRRPSVPQCVHALNLYRGFTTQSVWTVIFIFIRIPLMYLAAAAMHGATNKDGGCQVAALPPSNAQANPGHAHIDSRRLCRICTIVSITTPLTHWLPLGYHPRDGGASYRFGLRRCQYHQIHSATRPPCAEARGGQSHGSR